MSFATPHKKYADAVMLAQAYKEVGKRGAPSSDGAAKASYNHTVKSCFTDRRWAAQVQSDPNFAPGKGRYRHITAQEVNDAIKRASIEAIKSAAKRLKIAGIDMSAVTPAALFAVAAASQAESGSLSRLSRRSLVLGGLAVLATAAIVPDVAEASDGGYVSAVKRGLQSHVTSRSPAVLRGVGAGTRADLKSTTPKSMPA